MRRALVVGVAHAAALWPVASWSVRRVTEGDGDLWGVAAAVAAVAAVAIAPRAVREPRLGLATVLVALSAASQFAFPPLVSAAFGAASVAVLVSEMRLGVAVSPGLLGLALLALPSVSSLQFFVGWPFRVAVAACAAPLLSMLGRDAVREGATLVTDGRTIAVDAPCSGVWLLWGALLAWFTLVLFRGLGWRATTFGSAALLPLVFVANTLRTTALVVVETHPESPAWAHTAVGVAVLAAAGVAVLLISERCARCAAPRST